MKREEWIDIDSQKEKFVSVEGFIDQMSLEIDSRLNVLKDYNSSSKKKFAEIFQIFLAKIFSLLISYLPLSDPIINTLDFVSLSDSSKILKEKILCFNEIFNLVPKENQKALCEEINHLISSNIDWARIKSQESSLYLWDLIEGSSSRDSDGDTKYKFLKLIFKISHALPTSSACIEQSFSTLKFVKNLLRSNLQEETTQSLLIISQEFRHKDIVISRKLLESFGQIKKELNDRKSRNRQREQSISLTNTSMIIENLEESPQRIQDGVIPINLIPENSLPQPIQEDLDVSFEFSEMTLSQQEKKRKHYDGQYTKASIGKDVKVQKMNPDYHDNQSKLKLTKLINFIGTSNMDVHKNYLN